MGSPDEIRKQKSNKYLTILIINLQYGFVGGKGEEKREREGERECQYHALVLNLPLLLYQLCFAPSLPSILR